MRLQKMQQKLAEIAEIPRILSSTLATVSETFDKLTIAAINEQHHLLGPTDEEEPLEGSDENDSFIEQPEVNKLFQRKLSYDEDFHDFELRERSKLIKSLNPLLFVMGEDEEKVERAEVDTESTDDDNKLSLKEGEEFDAKKTYNSLKQEIIQSSEFQAKYASRDQLTPESDYNSDENQDEKQNSDNDFAVKDKESEQEEGQRWEMTFGGKEPEVVANNDVYLTTNFTWRPKNTATPSSKTESLKRKSLNVDVNVEETITAPVSPIPIEEEIDKRSKKFEQIDKNVMDKELTPTSSLSYSKGEKVSTN